MRVSAPSFLLLVAVALLPACDGDDPPGTQLRLIHAAPDAPAVDIYIAGNVTPIVTNISYGGVSDYVDIPPGTYTFEVRPAGAAADSAPVHTTEMIMIAAQERVTAIAVGLIDSMAEADRFRVLALKEAFEPVPMGSALARIVHAGVDAPTIAVDVGDDGTIELSSLTRFADSGAAGVPIPAGTPVAIAILTGDPPSPVTSFTTPALEAGSEVFVIATGSLASRPRADDGFGLLAVAGTGLVGLVRQDPVVTALHASLDAPRVDLFNGSTELVDDLAFGELSRPIQLQPGTYTIDFFAHEPGSMRPAGNPAASLQTPMLVAGERYLALASGFLMPAAGEPAFELMFIADEFIEDGAQPRLRFVHASPDTPAIDVGTVSGGMFMPLQGWTDVSFGETTESTGTPIPAGDALVGAGIAGTGSTVVTFDISVAPDLEAFVVALGSLAADSLRLLVIDTSALPWVATMVDPNGP